MIAILNLMPIIIILLVIYGLIIVKLKRVNEGIIGVLGRLYFSRASFLTLLGLAIFSNSSALLSASDSSIKAGALVGSVLFAFIAYSIWILIKVYLLKNKDLILESQFEGFKPDADSLPKPKSKDQFMGNPPFTKTCVSCGIFYDETWKKCYNCDKILTEKKP